MGRMKIILSFGSELCVRGVVVPILGVGDPPSVSLEYEVGDADICVRNHFHETVGVQLEVGTSNLYSPCFYLSYVVT